MNQIAVNKRNDNGDNEESVSKIIKERLIQEFPQLINIDIHIVFIDLRYTSDV